MSPATVDYMLPHEEQTPSPLAHAVRALDDNQPAVAARLVEAVCSREPDNAEAWLFRAFVHGRMDQYREVIACCERVISLGAAPATAYSMLGAAYAARGEHGKALDAHRRALAITPDDPGALHFLGNTLLAAGRTAEAIEQLRRVVTRAPELAGAHCSLARAYREAWQFAEAVRHYRITLRNDPQLFDAYTGLGEVLTQIHDFAVAEGCYRRGLAHWPRSVELYRGLGVVLQKQGKLAEALAASQQAVRLAPEDPDAIAGEANILDRQGDLDGAYERVRRLVDAGRVTVAVVEVYAAICRQRGSCAEVVRLCHATLSDHSLAEGARQLLYFILGKLYDGLGAYDDAFGAYAKANGFSRVAFDGDGHRQWIDGLIAGFSQDAIARMPRAMRVSERPVFIVGMPRSGTSLVEQILSSHPEIHGGGELRTLNRLVRGLPSTLYPQSMETIGQETVDDLAQRYHGELEKLSPAARRVTDKMPHNFLHLGVVQLMLPGARIIHCRRDPRDTCLSIYFQNLGPGHAYATDLAHLGRYYRQYCRLMTHWKTVLDLPILDVDYRELVTDAERITRQLVDFCGVPWDGRCLGFHTTGRVVATASYDQVRRPVYLSSLGRWRNYERHLAPLSEALGDVVGEAGGHG